MTIGTDPPALLLVPPVCLFIFLWSFEDKFVVGALLGTGGSVEELLEVLEFGYCGKREEDIPDKALPEFVVVTDCPTPFPIPLAMEELPDSFPKPFDLDMFLYVTSH